MKKIGLFLMLFALLLSACSSAIPTAAQTQGEAQTSSTEAAPSQEVQGTPQPQMNQPVPGNGELPEIAKILLGSFLLENSEFAITKDQAATLYPLWKGLSALQNSETVTNEELQGLYDQIISAMTDEQKAQIETLNLNLDSQRTVMESLGLDGPGGPGGNPGNLTEEQIATMEAERAANGNQGGPAGGPAGGPGGLGGPGMPAGGPQGGDAAGAQGAHCPHESRSKKDRGGGINGRTECCSAAEGRGPEAVFPREQELYRQGCGQCQL